MRDSPSFNPAMMDWIPQKQMESWVFCFSQGCFWGVFPCRSSIWSYFLRFIVISEHSGKNHSTAKHCPLASIYLWLFSLSHPLPLYLQPPLRVFKHTIHIYSYIHPNPPATQTHLHKRSSATVKWKFKWTRNKCHPMETP